MFIYQNDKSKKKLKQAPFFRAFEVFVFRKIVTKMCQRIFFLIFLL